AVLRTRRPDRRRTNARRPAALRTERAPAARVHTGRTPRRIDAARGERRAREAAGIADPHAGGLDTDLADVAEALGRRDRPVSGAARRTGLVHRVRLSVAEDVPAIEPAGRGRGR